MEQKQNKENLITWLTSIGLLGFILIISKVAALLALGGLVVCGLLSWGLATLWIKGHPGTAIGGGILWVILTMVVIAGGPY